MTAVPKRDAPLTAEDDDRVIAVLIGRGMVSRDEAQKCRATGDGSILQRLVGAGCLTAG